MNAQILIQAVIQQTTVFLAQLATAGGLRAPLTTVANQVFLDLSTELQNHGLRKNVIADMFGMTLRTYHRKIRELSQSQSVEGRSLWEALLEYVRANEPVTAAKVYKRFARDERDVVVSVLADLVNTGFCYRSGRGANAVYRIADAGDFSDDSDRAREVANEYLVWQAVYRAKHATVEQVASTTRLAEDAIKAALPALLADGRVELSSEGGYTSSRIDVPVGQSHGWEAAVFDHYQALVAAVCAKLSAGETRAEHGDLTGGATFSLDLWRGHPMEEEVLGTLKSVRAQLENLRDRLDEVNAQKGQPPDERLVFYFGQHFKSDRETE